MKVAVFGAGLVGRRTAELLARDERFEVVLVARTRTVPPISGVATAVGWPSQVAANASLVVLATASTYQYGIANQLLRAGVNVVTTADEPAQIRRLWALDELARAHNVHLTVGGAYSPGVSTVLAAYLAHGMSAVSTISTAQFGTGGPACAREHHRAMSSPALEVRDGLLRPSRGGSGRELVWFPDPIGAVDCYRAGLADPFLLHQSFPGVKRIESRQAATRRDRLTARLPMLRSPHVEGLVGGVWVEVRGRVGGQVEHRAMAATAPQATGAATMAAGLCREMLATASGDRDLSGAKSPIQGLNVENLLSIMRYISTNVCLWAYDGSQVVPAGTEDRSDRTARKWKISG